MAIGIALISNDPSTVHLQASGQSAAASSCSSALLSAVRSPCWNHASTADVETNPVCPDTMTVVSSTGVTPKSMVVVPCAPTLGPLHRQRLREGEEAHGRAAEDLVRVQVQVEARADPR